MPEEEELPEEGNAAEIARVVLRNLFREEVLRVRKRSK